MEKLSGKIAVVTGGTSGIGLATARRLVAEGAHVFITGRRQAELDTAVKSIGDNITGVQGDVANLADLDRLYATVKQQKGRIDILHGGLDGGCLGRQQLHHRHRAVRGWRHGAGLTGGGFTLAPR